MSSWWNKELTGRPKRWVIFGCILVALTVVVVVLFGSGHDAQAATITVTDDPGDNTTTTFTQTAVPYDGVMALGNGGPCFEFGKWTWQNTDGIGRVRFGWGHDVILCENQARTKWTSIPTFDIWHWLGYWQFDHQNKSRSQLGFGWLDTTSFWQFKFDALGVPLAKKERTLKCRYWASNHTANCTLYG